MKSINQMHQEFNDYMGEPANSVLRRNESIDHFSHHVYRQLQSQLKEAVKDIKFLIDKMPCFHEDEYSAMYLDAVKGIEVKYMNKGRENEN